MNKSGANRALLAAVFVLLPVFLFPVLKDLPDEAYAWAGLIFTYLFSAVIATILMIVAIVRGWDPVDTRPFWFTPVWPTGWPVVGVLVSYLIYYVLWPGLGF